MNSRIAWQLVIVLSILLSLGCGKESTSPKKDGPPAPFLTRTSPQNLLMNLKAVYNTKTFDQFTDLFDDQFEFWFCDADVQAGDVPERLSKVDEVAIHELMIGGTSVDSLALDYTIGPLSLDEDMTAVAGDSVWTIVITDVAILLKGRLPSFPEMAPQTWYMEGGECQFWFQKHGPSGEPEVDPYDGEDVWTIYLWHEIEGGKKGSGTKATEHSSWGSIKSLF